jgi:tetratricopeptide (TPR) repeat protein
MGAIGVLFFFAVAGATLKSDHPLRSGCGASDSVVANLPAGQQVEVRFALNGDGGACYKVAVEVDGKPLIGYVPAAALNRLDEFDAARRGGKAMNSPIIRRDTDAIVRNAVASRGSQHPASKATQLMEANQPREALEVLEKLLSINRKDPVVLALAGLASYRMDDLEHARLYWRESLDLEANPAIESMYRRLQRELAADKGSERTVGTRVELRYERGTVTTETARAMVESLDQELLRVSGQLGCPTSERIQAIVQSRQTYFSSTGAAGWSGGQYDGRIHIPIAEGQHIGAGTRRIFAHELTHACLHELGDWPGWLHEGLAQKLSGDVLSAADRARLKELAQKGALPKLERMAPGFGGMNAEQARLSYNLALAAADELMAGFGNIGLPNVMRNPSMLPRITEELDKRLGLSN